MKNAILFLCLSLCLQGNCLAKEKISLEDKMIGSAFKALAKTFVAIADINKLKKDNIYKIKKMEEAKFQKRYSEVYEVIKDLPLSLKVSYAVTEKMSKEQAIKDIKLLNKKKIYNIIDAVDDTVIANCFKGYLHKKKQETQKTNLIEEINKLWNKIIEKIKKQIKE